MGRLIEPTASLHHFAVSPTEQNIRSFRYVLSSSRSQICNHLLALLFLAQAVATPVIARQPRSEVRNWETPHNLESTHKLNCIELSEVKTDYNPVDLFLAADACVSSKRYSTAAPLLVLGLAFGRYDTLRVSDRSAHQAASVARLTIFGGYTPEQTARLQQDASSLMSDETTHKAFCDSVKEIGHPSYYPRYMVQHGMAAVLGNNDDALVDGFDPDVAWRGVMESYLKCPPIS